MYDIFFLLGSGIGNVIEALYAVEHTLSVPGIRTGVYLHKSNESFRKYLKECYGDVIVDDVSNARCRNLVHSFCVEDDIRIAHDYYFYVRPDYHSSSRHSETEQYLSVVKALYPSAGQTHRGDTLTRLREDYTARAQSARIEGKIILYPGGSPVHSARRWPYYRELAKMIGEDRVVFMGGAEDLDNSQSFVYPLGAGKTLPQKILNGKVFWSILKGLGLLKSHAHFHHSAGAAGEYFGKFSWHELVALFRRCRFFAGNDGGLTHLAAAAGAEGVVLFGPTSRTKNMPVSRKFGFLALDYSCQPCQFAVGGIPLARNYIVCPHRIKCLSDITPTMVMERLPAEFRIDSMH